MLAAALAGGYTFVLGRHPYAWIGMLVQAVLVGLVEERIMNRLEVRAESMRQKLDDWIAPRLHLAQGLARHAQTSDRLGAPALLRDLRFYVSSTPDVAAIHVVDALARVVSSAGLPLGGADGPVGAREWFSRLWSLPDKPLLALESAAHGETQSQHRWRLSRRFFKSGPMAGRACAGRWC